jgi:tetraacyldisaccharide 4'-kinase
MAYAAGLFESIGASVPVISVGNVLMGGSGKTPFVIYLAELLRNSGIKPAVVSRGYGGRSSATVLVVGEGRSRPPRVEAVESGDEPYLMAERLPEIPVLTGARRVLPIEVSRRLFQCNLAILDDGFQHLQLRRDVDIVVLNGLEDSMFPAGNLREPLSAIRRSDAVVLMGRDTHPPSGCEPYIKDKPVFRCRAVPAGLISAGDIVSVDQLAKESVVLASGIAHPERFRRTAEEMGLSVARHVVFRDHHIFTDRELRDVLEEAGGMTVLFTEKDWVRLPDWCKQSPKSAALRIGLIMEDEVEFINGLKQSLSGAWPDISSKL